MSKIFYDHLIVLAEVEHTVKEMELSADEKHELWHVIDELVHHRLLEKILEALGEEHHHEFLKKFHAAPYDTTLLEYLNCIIADDVESLLQAEIMRIDKELIKDLLDAHDKE